MSPKPQGNKENHMHPVCVQTLYVPNLHAAEEFYTNALGYEVEERYGDSIVQLKTEGVVLIIQELETNQAVPPAPATVLAFRSDDIRESMRKVVAAGGRLLHDEPQSCPVGVYVSFKDRAGIIHEILQFRT